MTASEPAGCDGAKKFKCVTHCIFDLDGTILNSETMYHDVVAQVCHKYGKQYPKALQKQLTGGTDRYISEVVIRELNIDVSVDQFEEELLRLSAMCLPKAPLQCGVERLLFHLRDNKIPCALATNSTAAQVRQHQKAKPEIFDIFQHAVTATDPDVQRPKPYPDLFLTAAARFEAKPSPCECLVFEDSLMGLQAGVSAGMQVILTPHGTVDPCVEKYATMVLHSLQDFKPDLFGLPPFKEEKPTVRECPPPRAYKIPLKCSDPCAHHKKSYCDEMAIAKCKDRFDWRSITENKFILSTLFIGVYSAIVYRLW